MRGGIGVRRTGAKAGVKIEPKLERCPGCLGRGTWETECCSGAGGCSCKGDVIDMGTCNVCGGSGEVLPGKFNRMANVHAIRGMSYIGSGPRR